MKPFIPALVIFLLLAASAGAMNVKEGIPAEFTELGRPQQTAVTIYYGGDVLGSFAAKFRPGYIIIEDPEKLVQQINAVKHKEVVAAVLGNELPANANLICTKKSESDCGRLEPEIAGVIFNESNLSAEIFINKKYLDVTETTGEDYLPLPKNGFSSIYGFNGAVSGIDGNKPNYSLNGQAVYSYDEKRLEAATSVSSQGARLDGLAAGIEREGWGSQAGLFRSRPMQMVSDADIVGVSAYSSLRTLQDAGKVQGSDVIIYLPRRSYVSIYRDGKLYASRQYDAGNQKIDTAELPEGAYNITLKIQEPDGILREETRFFAKSPDIPPPGRPVYYAEGGLIRKAANDDEALPQITGLPLARIGTVQRIDENMGLGAGMAVINDRAVTEGGAFFILPDSKLNASAMLSTSGDAGVQANYFYYANKISVAADARKVWVKNKPDEGYNNLLDDITQVTASANYGVTDDVYLGARGSYSKNSGSDASTSFGPYAEWRMWQEGESYMSVTADAARHDRVNEGSIIMRFSHKIGSYGVSGAAGRSFGDNSGNFGNARGWYEENKPGRYLEVGSNISADSKNQAVGTDAYWRGSSGQVRGSVQKSFGQNEEVNYGGNFSFGAAADGGDVFIGGERLDKSAVAIKTTGDAKGKMKIFVNGSEYSSVKIGDSQVIYLSPFQSYSIQLRADGDGMYDYDNNARKVTLYPGNVASMEWEVNKFYVVLANVVDAENNPLANASLEGQKARVATDMRGRLQAEISGVGVLNFKTKDGSCVANLPKDVADVNGVIIYKEPLVCR